MRPVYRQPYNRFSNWIEIDNLCRLPWWSVLLMHLFESSRIAVTFHIISMTYVFEGGCFCEQGKGFYCHCIPRAAAVCRFQLARYLHRTTNALSPWDSWLLAKLREAERLKNPELRTSRIFMHSTLVIVTVVTPRYGLDGRVIRGGFPAAEGSFLSSPELPDGPWGPTSPLSSVYREG